MIAIITLLQVVSFSSLAYNISYPETKTTVFIFVRRTYINACVVQYRTTSAYYKNTFWNYVVLDSCTVGPFSRMIMKIA